MALTNSTNPMPLRGFLLFLCFFLLTSCSQTFRWNQKLTVTVKTPDGLVSADSVVESIKRSSRGFLVLPEAPGNSSTILGEAVVLEVSTGRYLFVLMDGLDQLPFNVFPEIPYERSSEFPRWARNMARHRGVGVVPPEDYPMMVTFTDINDPTSVVEVDPNDLVATFGEGYALAEMTLEITDEAMTSGRVERLPFWPKLRAQGTFSGLDRFDPTKPDPLNYLTYRELLMP